jgi:hypothetical protein
MLEGFAVATWLFPYRRGSLRADVGAPTAAATLALLVGGILVLARLLRPGSKVLLTADGWKAYCAARTDVGG